GGFPRDVDSMVLTMLEKDRNNRFADVSQLRAECLRILANEGGASPAYIQDAGSAPVVMPPQVYRDPGYDPARVAPMPLAHGGMPMHEPNSVGQHSRYSSEPGPS